MQDRFSVGINNSPKPEAATRPTWIHYVDEEVGFTRYICSACRVPFVMDELPEKCPLCGVGMVGVVEFEDWYLGGGV